MNTLPLALLASLGLSTLLNASTTVQETPKKIHALLITGANNHDWEWTSHELRNLLHETRRFAVDVTYDPEVSLASPEALEKYSVFVLDYNRNERWNETAEKNFLDAVRGGTGVVVLHAADNAFPGWVEYETLVGHLWREGTGHGRFHAFDVKILDRGHPITRRMGDFEAHPDELYHKLVPMHGAEQSKTLLATAFSSKESGGTGRDEPMMTVGTYGEGRVFHTPLGHVWKGQEATRASFADPQFRRLVQRSVEWAATGDVVEEGPEQNTLSAAEQVGGWRLLFDGKTAAGWRGFKQEGFPQQGWTIEDGCLVTQAQGGGGDILTADTFGDFELAFEWAVTEKANSGVIYRVTEEAGATYETGPEYQVLDDALFGDTPSPMQSAAALYAITPAESRVLAAVGEFNQGRIVVRGWKIEHWLNGRLVASCDLESEDGKARVAASKFASMPLFAKARRGHIALQDHGDSVRYRSIKVRELDGEIELFNGRDLAGWTAHLRDGGQASDVWSVTGEGVLECKGNPIGYLRTEADYTNFLLTLQWRFDPVTRRAGNSGVLLRMIGEDKVWPKSIEAQLQSGSAGDFWNIDEYQMKTVAERMRGRQTFRTHSNEHPIGEWNRYEILVDGPRVVLMVNGEILNEAWECAELAGKICLQSEGAPIHFRDIRLLPLEASK